MSNYSSLNTFGKKLIELICKDKNELEDLIKAYNEINGTNLVLIDKNNNSNTNTSINDTNSSNESRFNSEEELIAYCILRYIERYNDNESIKISGNKCSVRAIYKFCKYLIKVESLNYKLTESMISFGRNLQKANKYLNEKGYYVSRSKYAYISHEKRCGQIVTICPISMKDEVEKEKEKVKGENSTTIIYHTKCDYCGKEITTKRNGSLKHHFCCREHFKEYKRDRNGTNELMKELGHDGKEVACQSCGTILTEKQVVAHIKNHIKYPKKYRLQSVYCCKDCFQEDHNKKKYERSYMDIGKEE